MTLDSFWVVKAEDDYEHYENTWGKVSCTGTGQFGAVQTENLWVIRAGLGGGGWGKPSP